jgi:hypothetical protein
LILLVVQQPKKKKFLGTKQVQNTYYEEYCRLKIDE